MDGDAAVGEVDSSPVEDDVLDTSAGDSGAEMQDAAPEPPPSPWEQFKQIPAFQGKEEGEIASAVYQSLQQQQQLVHQLRQYQSIVPVASEYLSNREMYERWKSSQGQAPAPSQAPVAAAPQQAAEEPGWWNPPKIRDAYKQYLVKDEQGREVISAEAPLEARHALTEYQNYRAEFAKKFLENPEETLAPMVAKVAEQRAQQMIQSQLARRDEEQFVVQIENENADWLRDESGNVSREAVLAQKYVEDAKRYGIQGAKPRWEFAKAMVERELLLDFYSQATSGGLPTPQAAPQQQPPADTTASRNMEFLRQQAMRTPPRASPGTSDPRVPKAKTSFAEKLAAQLAEEGLI